MNKELSPEYIFESSWEVCNMVGGIYTVLSTRAATLSEKLGDRLIFIGPELWSGKQNPLFIEDSILYPEWIAYTRRKYNLEIRVGRWNIPGNPIAVLVEFQELLKNKNDIYYQAWDTAHVNSMAAYGDYDDSSMFGWASGMIIESYYQFFKLKKQQNVVAQFHEWMTSFGVFYLKKNQPNIATIFTTHATSIGRSIAGNHKPLYNYLKEYNGDQMAGELNMVSKHSTEKQAARLADCFTTVSEITAIECDQLLDKTPDVVTPNGFEDDFVPKGAAFTAKRKKARKTLLKVAETLLGYPVSNDALLIGKAGRYEYKNKGIDVFIESMHRLNENHQLNREIIAFIMVPAWIKGHRDDLASCLKHNKLCPYSPNHITTHELHEPGNDNVMNALHWFHLRNQVEDKVKIIFVPAYLNGFDGIFNTSYYDLLIGMDLTAFPSYYEPWGYTPLESVAFAVPTITTNKSGFGEWVSRVPQGIDTGVGIIHRDDYNAYEAAIQIADMVVEFASFDDKKIKTIRKKAANIAEKALWKHFIEFYEQSYDISLKNKNLRS